MIALTPKPPYYAVIFTNLRTNTDQGYAQMAREMDRLAQEQPGYLGHESARDELGITVSYWENLAAISAWKRNVSHLAAQRLGKERWYKAYKVRICKVEMDYEF